MQWQQSIVLNLTYECDVLGFDEDKCLKGNVNRRYDLSMHVFISSAGPSGSRTLMYMSDICVSHKPGCVFFCLIECRWWFSLLLFVDNVCLCAGMLVVWFSATMHLFADWFSLGHATCIDFSTGCNFFFVWH